MDAVMSSGVSVPANILQPLFVVSNSSSLDKALENLIELARTADGRFDLASKNVLATTLHLCQSLSYPCCGATLLLVLKLIRNLCAGELRNQNTFIEQNGVDIVLSIISSEGVVNDSNYGIIRMGLQVLANVSLAGKEHQFVIWQHVYSLEFVEIARLRKMEICDPLCMIIYTCLEGNHELIDKLCSDHALPLLVEITRTASAGLPTGSIDIDALGYSLCILRDICACDGHSDIVDSLISLGLLEVLLDLLRELEPPAIIRKTLRHDENQDKTIYSGKLCPYKGFRSDIVAVIGNCAYRRKRVQDEIRDKKGIFLMLQQCVTDDENPFLREWGIWAVRNLLEGNVENQRLVSELEVQGSVDLPELSRLGLRVEVDQQTHRAKLVNSGST